jgi:hypothetical protein
VNPQQSENKLVALTYLVVRIIYYTQQRTITNSKMYFVIFFRKKLIVSKHAYGKTIWKSSISHARRRPGSKKGSFVDKVLGCKMESNFSAVFTEM